MPTVSELVAKKIGIDQVGIFDGEKMIGYVGPVIDGINRPTGTWCYTIPEYQKGIQYSSAGAVETMLDYVNWKAGKSWKEAAIKLAHKLGYKG